MEFSGFCLFYHQIFPLRLDEEQTLEFSSNGFKLKKNANIYPQKRCLKKQVVKQ